MEADKVIVGVLVDKEALGKVSLQVLLCLAF
jgi:hypothetical protein